MGEIRKEIVRLVPEGAKVLDLGCGDGSLMKELADKKKARPLGLEIDIHRIEQCVAHRVSALQMDLDKGLTVFSDNHFDVGILRYTIQEVEKPLLVFKEMLRVSRECIVVFSNFAHWRLRVQLFFNGRMPKSEQFPYEWYNTPNIHLLSLKDIERLCESEDAEIVFRRYYGGGPIDRTLIALGIENLGASTVLLHLCKRTS